MVKRSFTKSFLIIAALGPISLPAQTDASLEISLKRAIEIALAPDGNARVRLAQQSVRQAEARSDQARAALLPNVSGTISQQNQNRNLEAFGLRIETPIPGFGIPKVVGPFNTFDARLAATQTVFDFGAIRRYQSSKTGVDAASADSEAIRDQVARQVAGLYLGALRAGARIEAAEANVQLAEELLKLAANQKTAGTATAIDVTRANVQLANERQLLLVARNERRQANLQLLRAMGLGLNTPLQFANQLGFPPVDVLPPEQAIAAALESRADFTAQEKREEAARLSYSGARMERLPSVTGFADYGSIGTGINNAIPTRTYGVALKLPIFDGGRLEARRSEVRTQYEQERISTADLKQQIDLELRLAMDSLQSSKEQVEVARGGLEQAQDELARARRRYEAGVAGSIEVTDAQTRLARARDNHIAALFLYNQARIDYGLALGRIQQMVD